MIFGSKKEVISHKDFSSDNCHLEMTDHDRFLVWTQNNKISVYSSESRELLDSTKSVDGEIIRYLWKVEDNNDDGDNHFKYITNKNVGEFKLRVSPTSLRIVNNCSIQELSILQEIKVSAIVRQLVSCQNEVDQKKTHVFLIVDESGSLYKFDPKKNKIININNYHKVGNSALKDPLISANEKLILIVTVNSEGLQNKIVFYSGENMAVKWTWKLSQDNSKVTSISCCQDDFFGTMAATGHHNGQILIWRCGANKEFSFIRSIHHWHSTAVLSLRWDRGDLYSGGHEEVLIKWNHESNTPLSMVPRMGSDINKIFITKSFICLIMANNSIKVYRTTNLKKAFDLNGLYAFNESNIKWFSPISCIVLLTTNNQLQFIDPLTKKEAIRLEVVTETKITGERKQIKKEGSIIEFDITDSWLATARKSHDDLEILVSLWKYCKTTSSFSLITSLKESSNRRDFSVKFLFNSIDKIQLALIGSDKQLKLWTYDDEDDYWSWSNSYTFKDLEPSYITSSEDGSVIAISFGKYITLWKNGPHNDSTLITSFSSKDVNTDVTSIVMGKGTNSNLLFSTTKNSVCMWDLLRLVLVWIYRKNNAELIQIPNRSIVCIKDDNQISIIDKLPTDSEESTTKVHRVNSIIFTTNGKTCYLLSNQGLSEINWFQAGDAKMNKEIYRNNTPSTTHFSSVLSTDSNIKKKESYREIDPYSTTFENIQCPLSTFSKSFIDSQVCLYKNTYVFNQ